MCGDGKGGMCALCGAPQHPTWTVKAAQLFWEWLAGHLVANWGFTLNLYDQCVANKMINGSQCTMV